MRHPSRSSVAAAAFDRSQDPLSSYRRLLSLTFSGLSLTMLTLGTGCMPSPSSSVAAPSTETANDATAPSSDTDGAAVDTAALLTESWQVYRQRFIQTDGRVIDWESNSRTVSEGQAYAMLRAVLVDDADAFERTLQWAENNLARPPLPNDADGQDSLWAWKWGERPDGAWGIQDENFASDADIDAITALIFAARRWERPDYLALAYQKLEDLWAQSVLTLPAVDPAETRHYLLPGPLAAFQPEPGKVYVNPSYLAPYAFRLFAEVDPNPEHDWLALVDSSYDILEQTQSISSQGLPGDWVVLELATQTIQPVSQGSSLQSSYSFDAYRVWWRVTWDAVWFNEARAQQFLDDHLPYFQELWQEDGEIPAVMGLSGQALADYDSTSQYAMLYPAFQQVDPAIAEAMLRRKLLTTYHQGIWDNADAYYVQNLAWLGLFPAETIPPKLLE